MDIYENMYTLWLYLYYTIFFLYHENNSNLVNINLDVVKSTHT